MVATILERLKALTGRVFKPIGKLLGWLNPLRWLGRARLFIRNWIRRRAQIDYITLILPQQMPTLPEPRDRIRRRIFGAPPLSLTELDKIFERIGDDPRPKGVILHLRGFAMPLAQLQTLRNSLQRLREKGKRVICFAQSYSNATYFIASATDEIVMQPGGEVETLGLRAEATFLKDALDSIGVKLDSVAISPYKGAFDSLTRNDISPEGKAQLDWLMDSQFDILVQGMAAGRGVTSEAIRNMIDGAPHLDEAALEAKFVDAIETEEDLHRRLNTKHILTWDSADKKLLIKPPKPAEKYVALLKVSGLMMPGESGKPPVDLPIPFIGGERAGDLTVVQQVRQLMRDKQAAAVILFIDSGGGASSAAEAMTAALTELAKDRPVVAYMDSIAASGGYHIATPAQWIVAQPGTITGSIGVISAKSVTGGLFERLRVNRMEFVRGANAGYHSDHAPYTDEQRARAMQSIQHVYGQFVQHVARSRSMSYEAVDAVGGGRVWTGVQGRANGLVDELGDLKAALRKARELANLPEDAPLVMLHGKAKPLPAQLTQQNNPAAALHYLRENIQAVTNGSTQALMPVEWH